MAGVFRKQGDLVAQVYEEETGKVVKTRYTEPLTCEYGVFGAYNLMSFHLTMLPLSVLENGYEGLA